MASQVVRPHLPYRGPIPGGLHDGKLIEVKGSVPYGADSFEINLTTGLDTYSDRALHLSARFSGRVVVRNSMERNAWGAEERHGVFPFHSGKEFTIMISVDPDCFRIAVNSQHCWEFRHRILTSRISSILVDGSIHIERIEFINKISGYQPAVCVPAPNVCYPSDRIDSGRGGFPGIVPIPAIPTMDPGFYPNQGIGTCIIPPPEQYIPSGGTNLAPVYNPSIPYSYPIYGGLKPGMMIYISGRPSTSAYRFTLNFQSGTSPYPPPDIGLHFDARFYNHSIVRNSRTNNAWDREETNISHFPFQQSVNFDMMIRVESDRYMIALNGQHFLEFRHRIQPLSRFNTLHIENDIIVSSIRFT